MGLFSKLKEGLTKTRNNIVSGIDSVFSGFSKIDDDFYDELEETLIMGDIGVRATEENKKFVKISKNDPNGYFRQFEMPAREIPLLPLISLSMMEDFTS